jgi:succinate dehydrogenase / fumarate reductase iron-sulfur subunit
MNFKLKIWRQKDRQTPGKLVDYEVREISPNTSFLEMLDILNETLVRGRKGINRVRLPIAAKVFVALAR